MFKRQLGQHGQRREEEKEDRRRQGAQAELEGVRGDGGRHQGVLGQPHLLAAERGHGEGGVSVAGRGGGSFVECGRWSVE